MVFNWFDFAKKGQNMKMDTTSLCGKRFIMSEKCSLTIQNEIFIGCKNIRKKLLLLLFITRKYPLREYSLGVLTHTTAWDRLWEGNETLNEFQHFAQYCNIRSSVSPRLMDPRGLRVTWTIYSSLLTHAK